MKYLIASDIHGSAYFTRMLLEAYETEQADRLILLGDILYHGPRNDLPLEYNPKEVFKLLNAYSDDILAVRGNCDAEVDQMVLDFPIMADYAALDVEYIAEGSISAPDASYRYSHQEMKHATMFLTHGHHYNIDNPLPMKDGDIMIYGHTHVPLDEMRGGCRFLNPGSISIPKADSGNGYLIFDNGVFRRKLLRARFDLRA